jgi:hypothetical protein
VSYFGRFNYTTKQTDTQYLFGKEYPFFLFYGLLNEPAPFISLSLDSLRYLMGEAPKCFLKALLNEYDVA